MPWVKIAQFIKCEVSDNRNKNTSPALVVGGVINPGDVVEAETTLPAGECC